MPLTSRLLRPLAVALVLTATPVLADQAICVSKKQAEKALTFVSPGTELRAYCAPCKDAGWKKIVVESASVGSDEVCDAMLVVNGESVDLAYVYVLEDSKWVNLGKLVGAKVHDVPEKLPNDLHETAGD
jgi:hypothetical protein